MPFFNRGAGAEIGGPATQMERADGQLMRQAETRRAVDHAASSRDLHEAAFQDLLADALEERSRENTSSDEMAAPAPAPVPAPRAPTLSHIASGADSSESMSPRAASAATLHARPGPSPAQDVARAATPTRSLRLSEAGPATAEGGATSASRPAPPPLHLVLDGTHEPPAAAHPDAVHQHSHAQLPASHKSVAPAAVAAAAAATAALGTLSASRPPMSPHKLNRTVCDLLTDIFVGSRKQSMNSFWNVPFLPHSNVPPFLPVTRIRFAIFRAFTDTSSKIGVIIFWVMVTAVIASIISFCLATLPDARMRVIDGVTNDQDVALEYLDFVCAVLFTIDLCTRVLCVTAAPANAREGSAFAAHEEWRAVQYTLGVPHADCFGHTHTEQYARSSASIGVAPQAPFAEASAASGSDKAEPVRTLHTVATRSHIAKSLPEPVLPHGFRSPARQSHKDKPSLLGLLCCGRMSGPSAHRMLRVLFTYLADPLNIIDVAAVAPYYADIAANDNGTSTNTQGLLVLRVLRLLRLARLVKITGRTAMFRLLQRTLVQSVEALIMLAFLLLIGVIIFGAIVFYCEVGDWDPELRSWYRPNVPGTAMEESPFRSIPASMWWGVVTMATVGYGDMYPTTDLGRCFGSLCIVAGLVVISLPITIIGSNFTDEYSRYRADLRAGGDGFTITLEEHIANSLGAGDIEAEDPYVYTHSEAASHVGDEEHGEHHHAHPHHRHASVIGSEAGLGLDESAAGGEVHKFDEHEDLALAITGVAAANTTAAHRHSVAIATDAAFAAAAAKPHKQQMWGVLRDVTLGKTASFKKQLVVQPNAAASIQVEAAIATSMQRLIEQRAALGLPAPPPQPPRHYMTDEERRLEVVRRARAAARSFRHVARSMFLSQEMTDRLKQQQQPPQPAPRVTVVSSDSFSLREAERLAGQVGGAAAVQILAEHHLRVGRRMSAMAEQSAVSSPTAGDSGSSKRPSVVRGAPTALVPMGGAVASSVALSAPLRRSPSDGERGDASRRASSATGGGGVTVVVSAVAQAEVRALAAAVATLQSDASWLKKAVLLLLAKEGIAPPPPA